MAFFDHFREKFSSAALSVSSKARSSAESIKTSGEMHTLRGEIRRYYEELGRTIYESKGEDMDACRAICEKIDQCRDRLEELTQRDMLLRSKNRCPVCGKLMNRKAKFCSACGAAMAPETTTTEE